MSPFHLFFNRTTIPLHQAHQPSDDSATLETKSTSELVKFYDKVENVVLPAVRDLAKSYDDKLIIRMDKHRRVQSDDLQIGSVVMARNLRKNNKTEAYAEGPFLVVRKLQGTSYSVQDSLGKIYEFNRSDLKPVKLKMPISDQIEIQKVIDHIVTQHGILYQTKTKKNGIMWINEADFNSKALIQTYHAGLRN